MKRISLLTAALLFSLGAFAQKTAFVNTETIFRSMSNYNSALEQIDELAQSEQVKVDDQFTRIAEMYERYQYQKASLSETSRQQVEENIIRLEREATEYQQQVFGPEGTIMQRRIELLKPIQDQVFSVIDSIARQRDLDVIIDISNNPSIIYYNKSNDLSDAVLSALGIGK